MVDGTLSNLTPVISAVPQGIVIGPVLLSIQIRDIDTALSVGTKATSFADDTGIQRGVKSRDDCCALQADLDLIYEWAEGVNMHFNNYRFECFRLLPHSGSPPEFQYTGPYGSDINVKDNLNDLGVHMSSGLSFKLHVETVVADASGLVGWSLRCFRMRSLTAMKTI